MQQKASLLVVYADNAGELPAEQLAAALGNAQLVTIREGGLEAATKELASGNIAAPDYLAIDIGARGQDVLQELDTLAHSCPPSIRVIVAGKLNDVSLYRALIKRGIIEYYAYPLEVSAIVKGLLGASNLRDIQQEAPVRSAKKNGCALGFVSAASGDGASTTAMNVAHILANHFNRRTVLVDFDYQYGMIARHLDLQAPYGIRELFEYPERGVDAALVQKMLVPYGKNLWIIAAPNELRRLPQVQPELVLDLLQVLKSQFDYVVFDIPHLWVHWLATLLLRLDHVVLVAQLWLRSLTHVTRIIAAWREAGLKKENISLIINRSGSKFKEAMSAQDFERVSHTKIQAFLPNDTKAIVSSENQGKMLVEAGSGPLEKQLHEITQFLHTTCTGEAPPPAVQEEKSGLFSVFKR